MWRGKRERSVRLSPRQARRNAGPIDAALEERLVLSMPSFAFSASRCSRSRRYVIGRGPERRRILITTRVEGHKHEGIAYLDCRFSVPPVPRDQSG